MKRRSFIILATLASPIVNAAKAARAATFKWVGMRTKITAVRINWSDGWTEHTTVMTAQPDGKPWTWEDVNNVELEIDGAKVRPFYYDKGKVFHKRGGDASHG